MNDQIADAGGETAGCGRDIVQPALEVRLFDDAFDFGPIATQMRTRVADDLGRTQVQ